MGNSIDVTVYRQQWVKGICLNPRKDVVTNFLDELEEYSKLPRPEVEKLFYNGTEAFAKEWEEKRQDDALARTKFYDESFSHIFFVMHNSAMRTENSSPLLYLYALDLAKRLGVRHYLDYGAGTGSGAIFFAREGIATTVADISSRMLDFAKWRFERRGLSAESLDLKQNALPKNKFDMITCFHVLQHVEDPIATMKELRGSLTENGILIVNGALRKDSRRPMQPNHGGERTIRKFRSIGLQILWGETHDMLQLSNTTPQAYQKVERSPIVNTAYLIYDTAIVSPLLKRWVYGIGRPFRRFNEKIS
ncbi:MAG: class I SAM-dependent methyltransferase [Candidatus Omnitrophica bacterium]|nr:class I SAM-dependent methyltransferase [Candidatus Omnitrophota bacterium]